VERFRHLTACGKCLHEHAVGGLAKWVVLEEASCGPLGAGQLGATEPQAGGDVRLQRLLQRVVEPAPPSVEPWKVVLARQQRPAGDVLSAQRGAPGAHPIVLHDRGFSPVHGRQCLLDVDSCTGLEGETHGPASREDVRPDGRADHLVPRRGRDNLHPELDELWVFDLGIGAGEEPERKRDIERQRGG